MQKVWLEGFQPNLGILWDGFVYAVGTPGNTAFRYASIINGGPGALQHDNDDEINGMLGLKPDFTPHVPEGGRTFSMLSIALLALGAMARKGMGALRL